MKDILTLISHKNNPFEEGFLKEKKKKKDISEYSFNNIRKNI
jgi:hypothetical protein